MEYIASIMPSLLTGLVETLKIFALTLIFSLPLGLIISAGAMSRNVLIKGVSNIYVWLFRGTPLLLQLFFFYFFLPQITPIEMDRMTTAIFTFVLNYAAYFGEIYRAGIQSIDRGQFEAGKSLGFSHVQTMRYIVLPQVFKRILPPISNEVITLVKDTALVAALAVPELLKNARDAANRDGNPLSFAVAAAIYLLITAVLTIISRKLEKRLSRHEREAVE